ncbi:MAG TPA: hybrid sensor histidine kinase/response regulator [Bryobacteraceae bacterium]|jgi:DNA-binding response OmpR family regulator|nr:hybrid sensor histidine kinase/response regulator [Bryobacteraceae bacterium]
MIPTDIMIVDDNPANLKLLENMLAQNGNEIHSFPLGRLALAAAVRNPPDLILLDINMPEMNGYEVCERLKQNRELAGIPVIFLSALNDIHDKVTAFRAGAADYIAKPFQLEEVQARVKMHLNLHRLQKTLQQHNEDLERAVAERTRELSRANARLSLLDSSKDDFLRLISHELRTPLNGVLGVAELVLDDAGDEGDSGQLREMFDTSRRRLLAILDDALLLTQIDLKGESFRPRPAALHPLLRRVIASVEPLGAAGRVTIAAPPASADRVVADERLLERALHALLETAVKFSAEDESVRISYEGTPEALSIRMDSRGKSMPEGLLPRFFELFVVNESNTPAGHLGLGPAVASRILALFGGSVAAENLSPSGLRLTVTLHRSVN